MIINADPYIPRFRVEVYELDGAPQERKSRPVHYMMLTLADANALVERLLTSARKLQRHREYRIFELSNGMIVAVHHT
jgi:hypothetical protein